MRNYTDYFYIDEAEIFDVQTDGSYASEMKYTPIKTIKCDVQPISGGIKNKPHGDVIAETIKIFCAAEEEIKLRRYIRINGAFYIISGIKKWRTGYEIIAEMRDAG